jgi:mono/diheme cytochrome c family protein
MKRILTAFVVLGLIGAVALWFLTAARPLSEAATAGLRGGPVRGEYVFWAAGCASCHMAEGASGDAQLVLSGGQRFASEFGTFLAPNISNDPEHGIGDWTTADLANALLRGVSPEGTHYYPALPYGSYSRMTVQDVADLRVFLATLPADATPSLPHELTFPFSIRRAVGVWKLLYLNTDWALDTDLSATEIRGRYIVEALAHCGECHTPRTALGGLDTARWLGGAPNPAGRGGFPNITPGALTWSEDEIVEYLTSGFTPDFDSVGGHMAHVVSNMARLPEPDRRAIAAYLKRVPALTTATPVAVAP